MRKLYRFEYEITASDYRKMVFFNTFSIRRGQIFFVVLAWVAAIALMVLSAIGKITITPITHTCCMIVSVSVPVLLISVESSVRRYKMTVLDYHPPKRILSIQENGVRYSTANGDASGYDRFEDMISIFETRSLFIFYKDMRNTVLLPKSAIPVEELDAVRRIFAEEMGKRFSRRNMF